MITLISRIIYITFFILLSAFSLNAQERNFDVIEYDATLDLTKYKTKEVVGECRIKVYRRNIVENDFFPFQVISLKINSITANDIVVKDSIIPVIDYDYGEHLVNYPDNSSDTVIFVIQYSGIMSAEKSSKMVWGGVHYEEGILYSMGVGFHAKYVSTTRHWLPCYDHPSDKALFKAKFIVPENIKVASNGLLISEKIINGNQREVVWEQSRPSATYLLNFAAGNYKVIDINDYKIPIQIFTLGIDSAYSEFAYSEVKDMNDCFELHYGKYPFEKIGYCNTTKGAMEHQTMISMPRSLIVNLNTYKNSNNVTAAHELSHQWFGNWVSPLDFTYVWLNEAFATYSEIVWTDCRDGKEASNKLLIQKLFEYLNYTSKSDGIIPLFDEFDKYEWPSNYPTTIYDKGALVIAMLRYNIEYLGYDFIDIIKEYLNLYADGNVNNQSLKDILSIRTKSSWDQFFSEWVERPGWPKIKIKFDDFQNQKYSSSLTIQQTGEIYKGFPVEITYYTTDSTFTKVYHIENQSLYINPELKNEFLIDSIKVNQGKLQVGFFEYQGIEIVSSVEDNYNQKFKITNTNNNLKIDFKEIDTNPNIKLYDLSGICLIDKELYKEGSSGFFNLNIEFLNSGIYLVQITNKNKVFTNKIYVIK